MRDYKAECAALRAEIKQLQWQLDRAIEHRERRDEAERETRDALRRAIASLLGL